ncbi:MAG: hypothetical protein ACR2QK_15475 [Acidimicrobiales bacterium]
MTVALRLVLTIAAATLVVSACSDDNSDDVATDSRTSAPATTVADDETPSSGPTSTSNDTSTNAETSTSNETSTTTESTDSTDSAPTIAGDEVTCSAAGVERPEDQGELPAPVAEKRDAILTAALACDLDALAALTGPTFTASLGGGDPKQVWTADEEEFGNEPMRALVEILRLTPTAGPDGGGGIAYSWPPAFSYETWEEVPESDRDDLRVLYDDDDFEGFAQFGGYVGYRTVIIEDGTWTAFVAGD